jgi:hypothetical protein
VYPVTPKDDALERSRQFAVDAHALQDSQAVSGADKRPAVAPDALMSAIFLSALSWMIFESFLRVDARAVCDRSERKDKEREKRKETKVRRKIEETK